MKPLLLFLLPALGFAQNPDLLLKDGHYKRARAIVEAQHRAKRSIARSPTIRKRSG